jgi:mRNA interferase MazF
MAAARKGRPARAENWPKRGEIYLATLDPTVGREIRKTRPALVIQNDVSNEFSATTIIAPITSKVKTPLSPVHVLIAAGRETGLHVLSAALLNQIRTVDRQRLVQRLGSANIHTMEQVDDAIRISLGLIDF